jgi:O-acetyl-ADP-ribose deacetylase (regulator of RNase III)
MLLFKTGDILTSKAEALVNTVNTQGVMGKGIALQFKITYPNNFKLYKKACENNEVTIGKLFVTKDSNISTGEKYIVNFPTKTTWRKPSQYDYIEKGLLNLKDIIKEYGFKSIAIPPLGAGNGGLEWQKVKSLIQNYLNDTNIDIEIYEPTKAIKEKLKKERVKLTEARALLLYVLYDLIRNGEFVSEFSSEKVAYFLQRFGAYQYLKLTFTPHFYGPYSGKVRYILNQLNGSYLTGYNDMSSKPFEPLLMVADGLTEVYDFVNKKEELKNIAIQTTKFLNGFYSDFALELLSSVDYILQNESEDDNTAIAEKINGWSTRKRTLFSNQKLVDKAIDHIRCTRYEVRF